MRLRAGVRLKVGVRLGVRARVRVRWLPPTCGLRSTTLRSPVV